MRFPRVEARETSKQGFRQLVQKTDTLSNPGVGYVINTMSHSTRYLMTAPSNAVTSVDHQPNLDEVRATSPKR